jgi:uncharacterized membrane protein YhdT
MTRHRSSSFHLGKDNSLSVSLSLSIFYVSSFFVAYLLDESNKTCKPPAFFLIACSISLFYLASCLLQQESAGCYCSVNDEKPAKPKRRILPNVLVDSRPVVPYE